MLHKKVYSHRKKSKKDHYFIHFLLSKPSIDEDAEVSVLLRTTINHKSLNLKSHLKRTSLCPFNIVKTAATLNCIILFCRYKLYCTIYDN